MNTNKTRWQNICRSLATASVSCLLVSGLTSEVRAATATIYTNNFESFTNVAASLADTSDTDPVGAEWNIVDDNGLNPTTAGAGVQAINWLAYSGSKSLLLRSGTESQIFLGNTKSGTKYQLDFRLHVVKSPGTHNFLIVLRGGGADNNGDDYLAYRSDRAATTKLFYFDGIGPSTGWVDTGATLTENQWQHHRIVVDTATQTMNIYVDDMVNPIMTGGQLARPDSAVPTLLRIVHEGTTANDGYFAIDDISLTVDGSIDLSTTFTEGFESYPARVNASDDADPAGPWITLESDGAGSGRILNHSRVQVVDSSVVPARSGNKSLKLENGHRAGISLAWGQTPQSDVQITWWSYVPPAVPNNPSPDALYLRMSLYGVEGNSSFAGDAALLGYGIRSSPLTGDTTALIYYTTTWADTLMDFTPTTWEQYQLTTHVSQGRYTIIKNPSGANPEVIVDRAPFVGTANSFGPMFMAAWSSSNGTNHPPVYVDDITIKSLVSVADPLPTPYTITNHGDRFTNVSVLNVNGVVGSVAVDPRDNNTILFTIDTTTGGIFRARKVASGNWVADVAPIVTGLSNPSGMRIGADGTLWWVHDFTMSLRRLKAPWESNVVEEVISDFGAALGDDDPFDLTFAPATFNGSVGTSNALVVMDRGIDENNALNAIFLVDPATTTLNQTNYNNLLLPPSATTFGGGDLTAITALPQYGEVVTLSQDGTITAINADGATRNIFPAVLWTDFFNGGPAPSASSLATDPLTGRIWIADDVRDELWSLDPNPATQGAAPDQKETSFPLTNPERPDLQIDIHEPGLAFAPNGAFMVLSDTSTANGGGRLLIFHNETVALPNFKIASIVRSNGQVHLSWQSAGAANYRVQKSTDLSVPNGFQDISGVLTGTEFTDTNAGSGAAFYRVIATQ